MGIHIIPNTFKYNNPEVECLLIVGIIFGPEFRTLSTIDEF